MSLRRAAPLVLPAKSRHTATVIFMHGLGDSGQGWRGAMEQLRRRQRLDEVKFILPHAPNIPITVNGGFKMPGWFDIKSLGPNMKNLDDGSMDEDEEGILQSQSYIHSLIQDEINAGIPANRIVLGGFSQGGAMSLFSGLTAPVRIAGIVGLSCWALLSQSFKDYIPAENLNKQTPIFMGHGDVDAVVPRALAVQSHKFFQQLDCDIKFKTYGSMEHSACMQELEDVEDFISDKLPPKGKDEL